MFDYLLITVLFLWYKDPNYLPKFLNNLSWLFGILYARARTSSLYFKLHDFLMNVPISPKNNKSISLFILDENMLKSVDYKNINNLNSSKYYVKLLLKNNNEKIVIFNDKCILMNQYNNLLNNVEKNADKFSKLMEATINDKDSLVVLNKYINGNNNFSDITNYEIRYKDLYDFDSNKFLLEANDKIHIVNMNLEEFDFEKDDIIRLN